MLRSSLAMLLILVASVTAFGQCTDAERKTLEDFDKAWGEAGEKGDRAALANFYADDYMGMSIVGMLSKEQTLDNQIKAAERNRSNPHAPKVTPDFYEISCTKNTATIIHRNVILSTDDGKEETTYSRSVHFLEKRGGKWYVVSTTAHPLDDRAVLLYIEQEWNEADKNRDAAWFERNYADDATVISSRTGAITGKKEDVEDAKSTKRTTEFAELSNVRVRVEGNMGVVTGMNHVKGKDEKGSPYDRTISFTDTYLKRNGRWLVFATQATDVKK
jgi:ketosteroid isomerase-like protein